MSPKSAFQSYEGSISSSVDIRNRTTTCCRPYSDHRDHRDGSRGARSCSVGSVSSLFPPLEDTPFETTKGSAESSNGASDEIIAIVDLYLDKLTRSIANSKPYSVSTDVVKVERAIDCRRTRSSDCIGLGPVRPALKPFENHTIAEEQCPSLVDDISSQTSIGDSVLPLGFRRGRRLVESWRMSWVEVLDRDLDGAVNDEDPCLEDIGKTTPDLFDWARGSSHWRREYTREWVEQLCSSKIAEGSHEAAVILELGDSSMKQQDSISTPFSP